LLELLVWLLVPMGLLPVATGIVLWRYRNSDSAALRERARLALLLAVLGLLVALLALNRIASLGIEGEQLGLAFVGALLLIDIASGLWLVEYWQGRL
jgi:hypothetical protein